MSLTVSGLKLGAVYPLRFGRKGPDIYWDLNPKTQRLNLTPWEGEALLNDINALLPKGGMDKIKEKPQWRRFFESKVQTKIGTVGLHLNYSPRFRTLAITPAKQSWGSSPIRLTINFDRQWKPTMLTAYGDRYNVFGTLLKKTGNKQFANLLGDYQVKTYSDSTAQQVYRLFLQDNFMQLSGWVSRPFIQKVVNALSNHPLQEIKRLIRKGYRAICAETVLHACPYLRDKPVPYSKNALYNSCYGVFSALTRKIVVAEQYETRLGGRWNCYDVENTTSHEVAHGRDDMEKDVSLSRSFARAYLADIRKLKRKDKQHLSDTLGIPINNLKKIWARMETYAHLTAHIRQGSYAFDWLRKMPKTMAWMKNHLNADSYSQIIV